MGWFHKKEKKLKRQIREVFGKPKTIDFDFDAIRRFADRNSKESFQNLPDKVCDDLNFNDLFAYVDRTSSFVGQQCLYDRMRRIPNDRKPLDILEKWMTRFEKDEPFRTDIQYHLQNLAGRDAYYLCDLFQSSKVKPPKWLPMAYVLSFTNLLATILIFFTPQYFLLVLLVTIANTVLHYLNKKNILIYLDSMPQLLNLNRTVQKLLIFDFLKKSNEISEDASHFLHKISRKMNFFRLDELLRGDPFGVLWGLSEIIKIYFLLEPIFLFRLLRRIESHEKELQEAFEFVGLVDEAVSLASLRMGLPYYCHPEIISDIKAMHFEDVYLPIINNCVSNSLNVRGKSILITGSNMSGKTTFIRAVGINTLMSLTLNTCFARSFALPQLHLWSAILMNDDLMNDKSFYLEEVQTIKEMIEVSHKSGPNLFLLDEITKAPIPWSAFQAEKPCFRGSTGATTWCLSAPTILSSPNC